MEKWHERIDLELDGYDVLFFNIIDGDVCLSSLIFSTSLSHPWALLQVNFTEHNRVCDIVDFIYPLQLQQEEEEEEPPVAAGGEGEENKEKEKEKEKEQEEDKEKEKENEKEQEEEKQQQKRVPLGKFPIILQFPVYMIGEVLNALQTHDIDFLEIV